MGTTAPDEIDTSWKPAPAASHVESFRLIELENVSYLDIRFKAKDRWPMSEYRYTFDDQQEARVLFEVIQEMNHPGMLVWDELKRKGVPYEKMG